MPRNTLATNTIVSEAIHTPHNQFISSLKTIIEAKYDALGGERVLGVVDKIKDNVWYCHNGSCICFDEQTKQAFEIHGDIYQKWLKLGGLSFGVPCTDELPTPDGIGRFNHFNNGTASIYWTPATGACAIYGGIRNKWKNLGWERSYLGYPTSDEVDFPEGGRANSFQHGDIYWWEDTDAIDLRGVVMHYTGLYCIGESDDGVFSSADEPYVIVSISTPEVVMTNRSRIYEDVDAGDSRPDLVEIYRGKPYGINIGTVLMEHDSGDPNKYKKDVQDAVMAVHKVGVFALNLIPIVGPIIALIADPALGSLMPSIGEAINDIFGEGDDNIGSNNLTISARQMVLLATRTNNSNFKEIGFKLETAEMRGDGAAYKAYFGIVPA